MPTLTPTRTRLLLCAAFVCAAGAAQAAPQGPLTPTQQTAQAALHKAALGATTAQQMLALTAQKGLDEALVRREILRLVGDRQGELTATAQGRAFWAAFSRDQAWMESFLCSGSVPNAALSLKYLAEIWASDPQGLQTPLYRELATGTALAYAEPLQRLTWKKPPHHETPVARYAFFKQSHQAGKLHPSFDGLKAWEMRYLMFFYDNASLAWLQDNIRIPLGRLPTGEGCTSYQGCSVFGDGLSTGRYHLPWRLAGQSDGENHVRHGGVCGTLSGVGVGIALSRGIPACHAAQPPSHCAFTVRLQRHVWAGGFGGPQGRASQGFYGLRSPYDQLLVDAIFSEPKAVLASRRLAWLGHLYQEAGTPEQVTTALRAAIQDQPLNVDSWRDYTGWMFKVKAKQPAELTAVLDELTDSPFFCLFPSARGAELADDVAARIGAGMPLAKRAELLLDLYRKTTKVNAPDALIVRRFLGHIKLFQKDPAVQIDFLHRVLALQWGSRRQDFATAWRVAERGLGGSRAKPAMLRALRAGPWPFDAEADQANPHDWGYARSMISGFAAFISGQFTEPSALADWQKLAQSDLPAYIGTTRDAVAKVNAKIPAFTAPPGQLLSKDGLIHQSSLRRNDLPLLYPMALTESGGQLWTAREKDPAIAVRLSTPGTLSGIVVTPWFDQPNFGKSILPLAVWTSQDGKAWTQVATVSEYQPSWTLDLRDKAPKAAYVKFTCHHDKPDYLTLRRILVYGTPKP